MKRHERLTHFDTAARNLAAKLPDKLAVIRGQHDRCQIPAASMFRLMSETITEQQLKLDQVHRQYIAPVWNSLSNDDIAAVRLTMDECRTAMESAAREA